MKAKLIAGMAVSAIVTVVLATPALAQDGALTADDVQAVADNLWVFVAGVLVFLMQAGFAMVEAGFTRAKNVANIMAKNLADVAIGVLAFFVAGYAIAFGGDGNLFGDSGFFLSGLDLFEFGGSGVGNLSHVTFFFFQVVFAAVMTALVYPIVVHWTWGGGLIAQIQIGDAVYSDFAGSTIVHSTGAWAALMGAVLLGPRIGKFDRNGRPRAIPGHSMALGIIGVFVLAFGWFGFNPGSELAADNVVAQVAVNTLLAAAAGTAAAATVIWLRVGKPDVGMSGNGTLAGLVAITAPCAAVDPWAAIVIGAVGGAIVVFSILAIERGGIDDPVGAISVHGVCGIWGTLSIGLFAKYDDAFLGREDAGLFYGGGLEQLAVQALLVAIVAAWVLVTTGALFLLLKSTIGLRVTPEEEMEGLDVREHGAPGYAHDVVATGVGAGNLASTRNAPAMASATAIGKD